MLFRSSNLENTEENEENSDEGSEDGNTHRRRRRRRARGGADVVEGEILDEDGVKTVVKVREPKQREERPNRYERHDRHDRRDRRDRHDRGYRRGDREGREFVRRRGMVITEGEFLSRRENVNRTMLVRQTGDRTQIAVLEDKVMVEHYVNRNSNIS